MLHKLIEIDNGATAPSLLLEEHLQFPQFVKRSHIWGHPNHKITKPKTKHTFSISQTAKRSQDNISTSLDQRIRSTYRVRSICEGKASRFEVPKASELNTWGHLWDCSSPDGKKGLHSIFRENKQGLESESKELRIWLIGVTRARCI